MKTVMFKALNGEEVIARLIEETDTELVIEKARVMVTQQVAPGKMQAGLIPWFVGAPDETVTVFKSHIFARVKHIPSGLEKGYTSETSGLDLSASR